MENLARIIVALFILSLIAACGSKAAQPPDTAASTEAAALTDTFSATHTLEPTDTPPPTDTPQPSLHEQLNGTWISDMMTVQFDFAGGVYEGIAMGAPFTRRLTLVSEGANIVEFKSDDATVICQFLEDGRIMLTTQVDGASPVVFRRSLSELTMPQPTDTPATEPKPERISLQVLDSRYFLDDPGYGHVIATVKNDTDETLRSVRAIVTLFDKEGKFAGTASAYSELDIILPGETAVFNMVILEPPPEVGDYELAIEYHEADEDDLAKYLRDFQIAESMASDEFGYYTISGIVTNTRDESVQSVKVVGAAYNSAGKLIGVGTTYAELDVVPVGSVSPFKITFLYVLVEDTASFDLWVQARPVD